VVGRRGSEVSAGTSRRWLDIFEAISRGGGDGRRFQNHHDGAGRWYDLYAWRVAGADPPRVGVVLNEITERRRSEDMLRESEERQAFLLKLSDAYRTETAPEAVAATCVRELAGHLGAERCYIAETAREDGPARIGPEHHAASLPPVAEARRATRLPRILRRLGTGAVVVDDVRTAPGATELDKMALRRLGVSGFIAVNLRRGEGAGVWALAVGSAAPRAWTRAERLLVQDVAERTWSAIQRARADAALRESEARQRRLVADLQHRVRNILTVVRSVFARTVETGTDLATVADHFRGRLDALARTHVVATRNASGGVDLEELIRDELLSVGVADAADVEIGGPEVELPAAIAEGLGLAVHELTTNALKYGALSVAGGRLAISWTVNLGDRAGRTLDLSWVEDGVPALPLRPTREGFGRELIERALPYQLAARTHLEFRGGGVRCSISLEL
jgi:two-component sensor histidine kinase